MIDAGYNYDRLAEKMGWLDLDPAKIHHIEAGMSHGSKMALSRFLSFILSNSVLIRLEQMERGACPRLRRRLLPSHQQR